MNSLPSLLQKQGLARDIASVTEKDSQRDDGDEPCIVTGAPRTAGGPPHHVAAPESEAEPARETGESELLAPPFGPPLSEPVGATAETHAGYAPAVSEPAPPQPFPPTRDETPSDFDRRKAEALRLLAQGARYAGYAVAGYLALVLVLILAYRLVDPPGSTLMAWRWLGGASIDRTWVPLERISPHLVRAVVVAEDGRFCEHWGIDLEAMEEAIERAKNGVPRGASTISMQVTKNLFLWPSKSYLRKLIELPLTLVIELVWPKWRILEIYLNVAEWGPGVFGAEAAARHHFNKSAARLGEYEAALLAASLPNPVRRDAGDPGPRTSHKAGVIQSRMHAAYDVAGCVTARH